MNKTADTQVPLHPLIAERWSPRSLDREVTISREDLLGILEAGRWAPSAFNFQPWQFSVGLRGDEVFEKIASTLFDGNKLWAPSASALILISVKTVKDDGSPVSTALYDAGLAAAMMTVEASHRGFVAHHMTGYDHALAKTELALGENIAPVAIIAIGKRAAADLLEGQIKEREVAPRVRKPLSEISNIH